MLRVLQNSGQVCAAAHEEGHEAVPHHDAAGLRERHGGRDRHWYAPPSLLFEAVFAFVFKGPPFEHSLGLWCLPNHSSHSIHVPLHEYQLVLTNIFLGQIVGSCIEKQYPTMNVSMFYWCCIPVVFRTTEVAGTRQRAQQEHVHEEHVYANMGGAATGGSTNAVLHLIAMARAVGIPLSLDDWQRVSDRVPFMADLRPSGKCVACRLSSCFFLAAV